MVPAHPGEVLPTRDATVASLNWAGYADLPRLPVTGVASDFTVPAAQAIPPGFAASWSGIGGYDTGDLIQAGTTSDTFGIVAPQYYAWYELLPGSERPLAGCWHESSCTVRPGDQIYVNIHEVGSDLWSVWVDDAHHWSWHSNVRYNSSRSSAGRVFRSR